MLPENGDDLERGYVLRRQPSLSYRLDFENGRAAGTADGLEAMRQAVFLALQTERFAYEIYSRGYGSELKSLMGTNPPLVYAQLRQAVEEALSVDDRVTGVGGFSFARKGEAVELTFTVSTIYGELEEKMEVAV